MKALESAFLMRILMIGDVVGKAGRRALQDRLPRLRSHYHADFVIVNAENAAAGIGITPEIADNLYPYGVDVITLGNHAWGKREIFSYLDKESRILRPANYPPGSPGRGWGVYTSGQTSLGVIALQGRAFMDNVDDPFRAIDGILEALRGRCAVICIDFHAETTSEKQAMGWYVDGRVSAIVGTHTHIQTADERILPNGTAYLTDLGMTGPIESVIGMRTDIILEKFTRLLPIRFEVAEGEAQLCGVCIEVDTLNGKALSIERIQDPPHTTRRSTQHT
jgi:metallophosphoesterase (TIGR00282 family)